jgi:hypothetical protein
MECCGGLRLVAPTHSTMVTASGRFLDGPWRPSGSKGFMLRRVSESTNTLVGETPRSHLDLDTEHTLTEKDVTDSVVDVVDRGLTRVDHETVGELHRLGTGRTELARDDDLATLGARLHDEAEDTVAGTVGVR